MLSNICGVINMISDYKCNRYSLVTPTWPTTKISHPVSGKQQATKQDWTTIQSYSTM